MGRDRLEEVIKNLKESYQELCPADKIDLFVYGVKESIEKGLYDQDGYPDHMKYTTQVSESAIKAFYYTTGELPRLERITHQDDEVGEYEAFRAYDYLGVNQMIELTLRTYLSRFDPRLEKQSQPLQH